MKILNMADFYGGFKPGDRAWAACFSVDLGTFKGLDMPPTPVVCRHDRAGREPDARASGGPRARFVVPVDPETGKPDSGKALKPFGLHVARTEAEARKAYEADLRRTLKDIMAHTDRIEDLRDGISRKLEGPDAYASRIGVLEDALGRKSR